MNLIQRIFTVLFFSTLFFGVNQVHAQYDEQYNAIQSDQQNQKNKEKTPKPSALKDKNSEATNGKWDWRNFRIGGDFGLSFGSYTYVEISPALGYWILPNRLQIGVSTKFIYQSIKEYNSIDKYKSFLYGGGAFADYVIWNGLFTRGQFELVNKESYFSDKRVNVPTLLLGAGYLQPAGEFGNFYIAALFNVLDSDESIYRGTFGDFPLILQIGFGIGFPGRTRK